MKEAAHKMAAFFMGESCKKLKKNVDKRQK
jgi:hypothetical protein